MDKKIHHGKNVKRFREMLGIKQDALATDLGEDWNQKKVSLLETKDEIEPAILEQVAKVLKVPAAAIENFDEQDAINIISNTVTNHDSSAGAVYNYYPTFNPVDKWLGAIDEIKSLYERLLQAEREKVELLQKMLDKK